MTNPPLTINELIESARIHFDNLQADIRNASTRIEHIRLTTLAQEAGHLLTKLERFAEQKTDPDPKGAQLPTNVIQSTAGAAVAASSSCCGTCGCDY